MYRIEPINAMDWLQAPYLFRRRMKNNTVKLKRCNPFSGFGLNDSCFELLVLRKR
jgi:hypothetical protein